MGIPKFGRIRFALQELKKTHQYNPLKVWAEDSHKCTPYGHFALTKRFALASNGSIYEEIKARSVAKWYECIAGFMPCAPYFDFDLTAPLAIEQTSRWAKDVLSMLGIDLDWWRREMCRPMTQEDYGWMRKYTLSLIKTFLPILGFSKREREDFVVLDGSRPTGR